MNNIRSFREQRGWTLKELAEKAQLPFQTLSTYENGREPKINPARRVAKALKKPLDQVFPPAAEG
jgi:transcriptional regulator with XRE-family HTH domain